MRQAIWISAAVAAVVAAGASPGAAAAAQATRAPAGTLADGTAIEVITLANDRGVSARILTYGATLQSLLAPDCNGRIADVVLGADDLASYVARPNYFGVTVGRFANRIAGGSFAIDGTTYQLPANDGRNSLHGGGRGFDKVPWRVVSLGSAPQPRVVLAHTSPDGESGYPGRLDVTVTYALDAQGALAITFDATTDRPTIVNMTNHAIFNLAGEGAPGGALDQLLTIPARAYTPVSADLIPTGELRPVAGTPFDFRAPRRLAQDIRDGRDEQLRFGRGYDHNFALDKGVTAAPELAARLEDPGLGPGARGADHRARRAGLRRQLPRRHLHRQVRPHLPDGRRHRARAAEVPRRAQSPELRVGPGRSGPAVSPRDGLSPVLPGRPMSAPPVRLRSRAWFDNSANIDMTALYLERYLNYGLSLEELRSGRPIIGIAQTGSDLSPCNRHHLVLAQRVRDGIREMGGIAIEFPVHPIQETGKRPTAALDRNLAYLGLVEALYGYPIDGVVLTIGCDKTTPACLMAAATVNIPAIALSVGPMLNGWHNGERTGSGTIVWKAREMLAAGTIDDDGFIKLVASSAPSTGYCNTMGTATTMNSLAEALGMMLPGSAAIPAPYRDRQEAAYRTGRRIVEMVAEDLKPSDILTRDAFHNAIVVNSAIGGSTNAPIHLTAIARHIGVDLPLKEWETVGHRVPLLVNLQPAGEYLGEDYYRAGGVPAVVAQLMTAGLVREGTITVNGRTLADNCRGAAILDERVIRPFDRPLTAEAGFLVLSGNLFDAAIMKTSVIGEEFRSRYLSNPEDPEAFEGPIVVFDGPEDYHRRIDDPALGITPATMLFMRGTGPIGYPGAAEVVNMRPPAYLITEGVSALPCVGDGRQSGTSASPSILNASPEAAVMGGLALLRTGDRVRIDLKTRTVDVLIDDGELAARRRELEVQGGYAFPRSQTPWQEIQRSLVGQLASGAILEGSEKFQRIAQTSGLPRDNH